MFKNAKAQPYIFGFAVAAALASSFTLPASAQSVIIINNGNPYHRRNYHRKNYYRRNPRPRVGNFIYGSPIPTPVPVNPATGHIPTRSYFYKPRRRRRGYRSIYVNPGSRKYRYYRKPRRRDRQPASRIIINYPR